MSEWVPDDASFALLLTHDVDRPYKTYQSLYYAVRERDPSHLRGLLPGTNPYWTFDEIRDLEDDLGVRSAFYFLDEQSLLGDRPLGDLLSPAAWRLYAGRYSVDDPAIAALARDLDAGGWEVGLHGSYDAYTDRERLGREKERLEDVLDRPVTGGRQHYLNLERPETWRHQRSLGLRYDATPGSPDEFGFQDGYRPFRPFDDEFVVFPLTLMECALPDPATRFDDAWQICRDLLAEALEEEAVMSVLWHPRFFSDDYEGYAELYARTIELAQRLGAWVGTPGELYERTMAKSGVDGLPGDADVGVADPVGDPAQRARADVEERTAVPESAEATIEETVLDAAEAVIDEVDAVVDDADPVDEGATGQS